MKKPVLLALMAVVILISVTSCLKKLNNVADKPLIVTTIYPYELIIKQLVDSTCTVETLLPPNASPHSWSPAPLDVAKLQEADVIISNGLGLETNLQKTLSGFGTKHIEAALFVDKKLLLSDTDGKETVPSAGTHPADNIQYNPHIWTNPQMIIMIVKGLSLELGKRYPALKTKIDTNMQNMIDGINQTDRVIKEDRAKYNKPSVITLHDAFIYFFRYYDIDYVGAVQPTPGRDPSPRQLQDLANTIREKKIKAIFIEPAMNPKPAKVLAKELNLKVLEYDDLGTTLDVENISGYLYKNWTRFKDGF